LIALCQHQSGSISMPTRNFLATAIVVTLVTPALAQGTGPGPQAQRYSDGYNYSYNNRYYRDDFWPGQVAGNVVGGAIGTAGAIATAPFRAMTENNSYAMAPNASYCAQRYRSYDPGSGTYMGYDGRRHPC
jgi:BA14K-like protein